MHDRKVCACCNFLFLNLCLYRLCNFSSVQRKADTEECKTLHFPMSWFRPRPRRLLCPRPSAAGAGARTQSFRVGAGTSTVVCKVGRGCGTRLKRGRRLNCSPSAPRPSLPSACLSIMPSTPSLSQLGEGSREDFRDPLVAPARTRQLAPRWLGRAGSRWSSRA